MPRFRACLLGALLLVSSGCLHIQLRGPISDSIITVAPLRDPGTVLYQTRSWNEDDVQAGFGANAWNRWIDTQRLLWLGSTPIETGSLDADALYLVTAFGGFEEDAEGDGVRDNPANPVFGQWHAILTGKQLTSGLGKVTPLTEALYRSVELQLAELGETGVRSRLDIAAQRMVPDLSGNGVTDYEDILYWHQGINRSEYRGDFAALDALAQALALGASSADIRSLSRQVTGAPGSGATTFQVSGSILVSDETAVDSDVNDPAADYRDNSRRLGAQALRNPVVLGGYANVPFAGESGTSRIVGDEDDYFEVDLLAGQKITLIIGDSPLTNDLDLYLYDRFGFLVDASLGFSEIEQLTVPESGVYLVDVVAFEGASTYRLSIGLGDASPNSRPLRLSDSFVSDEVITEFRQDANTADTLQKREALTGMQVRGGLRRANLLRFGKNRGAALRQLGVTQSTRLNRQVNRALQKKLETVLAMKRLRLRPEIGIAELNYRRMPSATPNDTYYGEQSWHYEQINLPPAWDHSLGDNTVVAVVDTGVLLTHPDLAGQLLPGYDFISSPSIAADGDGIDADPTDPGDSDGNSRSSFHGTHVSGTIAATSNNGRGVAGVSWNSRIMPLRALGVGGGTSYDVLQAVRFAGGLSNDSGTLPPRAADVINLSLSGSGFSTLEQALYDELAGRGVIVVAAAGNDASQEFAYPASYNNVISVSALNINRERAAYSNFGSRIDLAAPGGDTRTGDANGDGAPDLVLSTSADDSAGSATALYEQLQGTSMAAPHVAGVIALMKSIYPQLTSAEFESLLSQGALTEDLGASGRDNLFGHGLINAYKSVLAAEAAASGEQISDRPVVTVSSSVLNYGALESSAELGISNGGTGRLEILGIRPSEGWLSTSALQVDPQGTGRYRVDIDRSQLGLGTHRAELEISSNGGIQVVQVILQQLEASGEFGDAGLHYVLLINALTDEVEQQVAVYADAGRYHFDFSNVPPGSYHLLAGSDADNDFYICDSGEACGAYPVLDQALFEIEVFDDVSGLDFTTTFNGGITASSLGASNTSRRRAAQDARRRSSAEQPGMKTLRPRQNLVANTGQGTAAP